LSADGRHERPSRPHWSRTAALAALLFLAALAAGLVVSAAARWRSAWLISTVTSRGFLIHASIVVIGAALLTLVLRGLKRISAAYRRRYRFDGQSGTAIIEFALVMPIGLFLVLLMAQSAMLLVGHLCVHYAAFCAARSAVVYVPADFTDTSGEEPNYVIDDAMSSPKMGAIQRAAAWAVLPISSSSRHLPAGDAGILADGIDGIFSLYGESVPVWVDRLLAEKLYYAETYTDVELLPPADGDLYYGENEEIHVTVRHIFYLSVPYARRLYAMIDSLNGVELDFGWGEYGLEIAATCRLTNEGSEDDVIVEELLTRPIPGKPLYQMHGVGNYPEPILTDDLTTDDSPYQKQNEPEPTDMEPVEMGREK